MHKFVTISEARKNFSELLANVYRFGYTYTIRYRDHREIATIQPTLQGERYQEIRSAAQVNRLLKEMARLIDRFQDPPDKNEKTPIFDPFPDQ